LIAELDQLTKSLGFNLSIRLREPSRRKTLWRLWGLLFESYCLVGRRVTCWMKISALARTTAVR